MHCVKSKKCRKRKVQTLALLAVIVILYFLLQFFSVSRLSTYRNKNVQVMHAESAEDIDRGSPDQDRGSPDKDRGSLDLSKKYSDEVVQHPAHIPSAPRGVHPSNVARYSEDSDGMFTCMESKLRIPMERVNDNFCDCPDSSDEPGTSACPDGKLFEMTELDTKSVGQCPPASHLNGTNGRTRIPQRGPQFVHSSKVNDGICDCCDGSDEWAGQEVPPLMRLKGKTGAVLHAPCADRCGDIRKLIEDERRIQQKGLLLQKRYLDAAKQLSPREKTNYGPLGIFYLLSQQCYEHSTHEYRYTICPFQSVKQSSGAVRHTVLGRDGRWVQLTPGDYLLTMAQGDATLCPDGQPRQTQIRFLCGLEDHVISIHEDQKCRYVVRFSSPAAC
ncbi:hypothetical protein BaRGS_00005910 [Batillaria attramentaria]|uniref:Glucosidase 2 subunit beta n=1 Tax=Batillaria attramentaria TaxID=370345 RepID=A0ABD0LTY4_9CAEN